MFDIICNFTWPLSFIQGLWTWLSTPTIIPLAGILAAIGAALTIRPKDWVLSIETFLARALRVGSVWILIVVCIGSFLPDKAGSDNGTGSGNENANKKKAAEEEGNENRIPPTVVTKAVNTPQGGGRADLTVKFVASKANETVAQKFACDLLLPGDAGNSTLVELRASNMLDFEKLLVEQLRQFKATIKTSNEKRPTSVFLETNPSPGQSVLRRLSERIRIVLENCEISIGDSK